MPCLHVRPANWRQQPTLPVPSLPRAALRCAALWPMPPARADMASHLASLGLELELYKKLEHKHIVGYIDAHFDARTSTLYIFLEVRRRGAVPLQGGGGGGAVLAASRCPAAHGYLCVCARGHSVRALALACKASQLASGPRPGDRSPAQHAEG